MATWDERIKNGNPVNLHNERFLIWHTFIDNFKKKYEDTTSTSMQKIVEPRPATTKPFEQHVIALGNTFSKVRLSVNDVPLYIFDASFGSLDAPSDLDVQVIAIDTQVIHAWIEFLSTRSDEHTFTSYYDSNFYFEPAILKPESLQLISMAKNNLLSALSTTKTMFSEMERIEKYAKAYITKTAMSVDGLLVYPNPLSPNFDQDAEIVQYRAMAICAQMCFDQYSPTTAAKLASTKSEGLLSVGSLAICGVFGPDTQMNFIGDETPEQAWRLVAAFEMLYNIKMHRHDDGAGTDIKSKYLTRLNNVLLSSNFTCKEDSRSRITRYIKQNQKKKNVLEKEIIHLVNAVVEDEINKEACPRDFEWDTTLNENIIRVRNTIINRSSRNVLRGRSSRSTFSGGQFLTYVYK